MLKDPQHPANAGCRIIVREIKESMDEAKDLAKREHMEYNNKSEQSMKECAKVMKANKKKRNKQANDLSGVATTRH